MPTLFMADTKGTGGFLPFEVVLKGTESRFLIALRFLLETE
jgi:hypothetical protein